MTEHVSANASDGTEPVINEYSVVHIPTRELTADLFKTKIDEPFEFIVGDMSLPVTLTSCRENEDAAHPDADRTPFLMIFRADLDESNPLQNAKEFLCRLSGLDRGPIDDLMVQRVLRPVRMPEGAYFQLIFG